MGGPQANPTNHATHCTMQCVAHPRPCRPSSTDRTPHAAFESESGAGVDEVGRASLDVQDEAEGSRTRQGDAIEGERTSALAHRRTTMSAV